MSLPNPILRFTDGSKIVDLLAPGSGWKMTPPYWNPQIAQYKRGGFKINPSIAEGQRLVHKEYDNVVESIPLSASGPDQNLTIATINELLSLSRQAADYWAESYEFDDVWMEVAPACEGALVGYARVSQMRIPELTNPFGQPFFAPFNEAVMDGITLIVEREPLWRAVPPGQIIGPLYNLIKNSDFELWNFGVGDSQPDSWTDLETLQITGSNNQQIEAPHSGNFALQVRVSGSTATNRFKGVTQLLSGIQDNTEYTAIAWVRSAGVSNGVGRILITYSSQLELYRRSTSHGWELFTGKFTTGVNDIVAINCEILTTAANTDGTVYFDSLMVVQGDWEQYAIDKVLPYLSSSHIVNHWDQPGGVIEAGDINYVDAWDVPGNVDSLVRLALVNSTTPSSTTDPPEVIARFRVGMRRAADVFDFRNYADFIGPTDTSASGNDRIETGNLSSGWTTVASYVISEAEITPDNLGRYRAIARVYDTKASSPSTLQVRIQYWIGAANIGVKTLDPVDVPIVSNWCVVDLTPNAGVNWDTKFNAIQPGQLGYNLQMRRTTGTDEAYLDYVMFVPTDGGILYGEIDPAITENSGLVVDTGSNEVSGIRLTTGFEIAFTTFSTANNDFAVVFNGALYIGCSSGIVVRFRNNVSEIVQNFGIVTSFGVTLVVFNNRLFMMTDSSTYSSDGITFPGTNEFNVGTTLLCAIPFEGSLWMGAQVTANVYKWDGTTLTLNEAFGAGEVRQLEIYQNKLYAGVVVGGTGRVYEYNSATDVWTLSLNTGVGNSVTALKTFKGKLYAGNTAGTAWAFDGTSWTIVLTGSFQIQEFGVADNKLYAATRIAGTAGNVRVTENGTDWEIVYDNEKLVGGAMAVYEGRLFIATVISSGRVYAITFNENAYKVSDYQLVPFYSPPKKRHRFFFNWDRENFVNNVDDTALIGIGFVPRYLALRGNR